LSETTTENTTVIKEAYAKTRGNTRGGEVAYFGSATYTQLQQYAWQAHKKEQKKSRLETKVRYPPKKRSCTWGGGYNRTIRKLTQGLSRRNLAQGIAGG